MYRLYLLIALCLSFPAHVLAEEGGDNADASTSFEPITQDINGRLQRLEQFLNNSALLDMLDVLEQLKIEVSELRGEIEVQSYNIEQLQQKQRDLYTDVDGRLQRLEQNKPSQAVVSDTEASSSSEVAASTDGEDAEAKPDEEAGEEVAATESTPIDPVKAQAEYQRAFKLLKESRYDQALAAFKQYLKDFPGSDYADNAQYWLGETNYVMQQYDIAINEYQALLNTYPDSQKVSHAMLKIGYSYAELGNTGDAEKTLNEVKAQYPGTTAARLADERLRKISNSKQSNS